MLPSSYQFFLTISQMHMRKWTVFAAGKKVQAMELQEFKFNLQYQCLLFFISLIQLKTTCSNFFYAKTTTNLNSTYIYSSHRN